MPSPKHILVVRLSAMGDVAMTVPVIKAVLKQNPGLRITLVSRPEFAEFFKNIDHLIFFSADFNIRYKGFAGILKLFKALKNNADYDFFADLHNSLRSRILRRLFRLSGIKYGSIDKGRAEKKLLTRFPDKVLKPLKKTAERYADVFRQAGLQIKLDNKLIKDPMPLTPDLTAITGEKAKPWIGIAPFAKHKGKIYPLDRTEEVIRLMHSRNVNIFLFGGSPLEKEICTGWEQRYNAVKSLVGNITMEQELAIISNLDVMMSMDSAGMHLASLGGVPVVSIWGATHHYAGFLGYGQSENNIVADDIVCRPCSIYGNKPCFRKDYACLYNIPPETVVNRLIPFIS